MDNNNHSHNKHNNNNNNNNSKNIESKDIIVKSDCGGHNSVETCVCKIVLKL